MSKESISVVLMLTVAPLIACSTLVSIEPSRWGLDSVNPWAIASMAFFGLFTLVIWPTYIPALVLTPVIMRKVASKESFRKLPVLFVIFTAALVGALLGSVILAPMILMSSHDPKLLLAWISAGSAAGGVTLPLITLLYRRSQDVPPKI